MLSFKFISSSGGVASYYESEDDYYTKDGPSGQWEGRGAEALGLAGGVERETFKNLLDGRLPNGEQIRKRMTHKQGDGKESAPRLGIDFTFSVPKSVSIAALVNGDAHILHAHDEAVRAAILMLEGKAIARKKVNGVSYRQNTHNLVVAAFRHDLSRSQDPQLHTHAVVMNMTQRDDLQWVALTNDEMLKSVKLIGAFYRSELAQRLVKMGYEIRSTRDGFELAGVSDQAIDLFSKRSQKIESVLAEKGLDRAHAGGKLKQKITSGTRPKKTDADRAQLRGEWTAALAAGGIDLKNTGPQGASTGRAIVPEEDAARRAVDFAIEHMAERQGIFTKDELLGRAVLRSLGPVHAIEAELAKAKRDGRLVIELPLFQSARSFSKEKQHPAQFQNDQFRLNNDSDKLTRSSWVALTMAKSGMAQPLAEKLVAESIKNGRLVQTEDRFTTPVMLATEKAILRIEAAGRVAVAPIKTGAQVEALFAASSLNQGQKDAAGLILSTRNRFVGIQGYAGTGKSHMLSAAVDAIKAETAKLAVGQGYTVIGVAPYASQNKALAELGMESTTLASFLLRKAGQNTLSDKTIVFLDESSVVPAHQMLALMEKVEAAGARLVLVGDRKQTQAVESGKPFEQLQEAGMTLAHLTEILRQKTPELKAAVVSAAGGRIDAAVRQLSERTVEITKEESRHALMATDYSALPELERRQTLIVAGTNEARRSINRLVRDALHLGDDHEVATYDSIDMTRAEKKEAGSYAPGQVILLEGAAAQGLEARTYYEIFSVADKQNRITVQDGAGRLVAVDPAKLRNLSVFEKRTIFLARGDWIAVTRNNTLLGVANGERYQIKAITSAGIELGGGLVLPRTERLHLQHGYAATVHSAQGLTTERVMIDANTKSLTSNRAVFYVAISRPRTELKIYTDSRAKLVDVMVREPKKYAALELRSDDIEKKVLSGAMLRQQLQQAMTSKKAKKSAFTPQRSR